MGLIFPEMQVNLGLFDRECISCCSSSAFTQIKAKITYNLLVVFVQIEFRVRLALKKKREKLVFV